MSNGASSQHVGWSWSSTSLSSTPTLDPGRPPQARLPSGLERGQNLPGVFMLLRHLSSGPALKMEAAQSWKLLVSERVGALQRRPDAWASPGWTGLLTSERPSKPPWPTTVPVCTGWDQTPIPCHPLPCRTCLLLESSLNP